MILAPRTLRPGAVYRCVVSILYLDHPVDVRASLQKDGVEIASAKQDIIKGYPETLLLQVFILNLCRIISGPLSGGEQDAGLFILLYFLSLVMSENHDY